MATLKVCTIKFRVLSKVIAENTKSSAVLCGAGSCHQHQYKFSWEWRNNMKGIFWLCKTKISTPVSKQSCIYNVFVCCSLQSICTVPLQTCPHFYSRHCCSVFHYSESSFYIIGNIFHQKYMTVCLITTFLCAVANIYSLCHSSIAFIPYHWSLSMYAYMYAKALTNTLTKQQFYEPFRNQAVRTVHAAKN